MKEKLLRIFFLSLFGLPLFGQTDNFALQFDGVDDHVELPKYSSLLGNNFTVEGWIKCTANGQHQNIVFAYPAPNLIVGSLGIEVHSQTGALRFFYAANSSSTFFDFYSIKAVDNSQWTHFACVKEDNRILKIYLNGVLDNVLCIDAANIDQPVLVEFGRNVYATNSNLRPFNGKMDDLKIWDIAKSNREIFNDFQQEHDGTEAGLLHNYKFDVQSDTIFDCSANKNHGTRKGSSGANNKPQFSTDFPALTNAECSFMFVGTHESASEKLGPIQLVPNPATSEVTISLPNHRDADARLFDQTGKLVRHFTIVNGVKTISTAGLPAGVYELQVATPIGVSSAKLVKI